MTTRPKQHTFTTVTHPKRFRNGIVKFKRKLPVRRNEDNPWSLSQNTACSAWGRSSGHTGEFKPDPLTNPGFVKIDGDSFLPNRNTLDLPPPVKFKQVTR